MSHLLLLLFCFELVLDCYAGSYLVNQFSKYESAQSAHYNKMENDIYKKWHEVATSTQKTYVNYYQNNNIRLMVDYEKGTINLEGINSNAGELKEILNKVISENDERDAIINLQDVVKDQVTSKSQIIKDLLSKVVFENSPKKMKSTIKFQFLPDHLKRRAKRFRPIVADWADRAKVDFALVMAIIRQESAFNPKAESRIPAFGLMQIVPKYAGRDVMINIFGKDEMPSKDQLFDPETNIVFGVGYLKFLDRNFRLLTNDFDKKESLVIASYNWGPRRIINAIKHNKIDLNMPDLQGQINKIAPNETINYLQKVKSFKTEFQNME